MFEDNQYSQKSKTHLCLQSYDSCVNTKRQGRKMHLCIHGQEDRKPWLGVHGIAPSDSTTTGWLLLFYKLFNFQREYVIGEVTDGVILIK